jgi:hypothetical protein
MNVKPLDLAALQAICDAVGETVRQEAIASGALLPVWDDARGVVDIDPVTGREVPSDRASKLGLKAARAAGYFLPRGKNIPARVIPVSTKRQRELVVKAIKRGIVGGKPRVAATNE